jgi:hypothetical protein
VAGAFQLAGVSISLIRVHDYQPRESLYYHSLISHKVADKHLSARQILFPFEFDKAMQWAGIGRLYPNIDCLGYCELKPLAL